VHTNKTTPRELNAKRQSKEENGKVTLRGATEVAKKVKRRDSGARKTEEARKEGSPAKTLP